MGQGGGPARKSRNGGSGPTPLTPADCTLSGYPSIMIDIPRLRQSDFDATTNDTAWRAGINLWFSAWESTPAGSLRADDAALAKAAGMGRDVKGWLRIKSIATQGFVLCRDGRLYHRTLSEIALGIWIDKLIRRHAGQKGNRGSQSSADRQIELSFIEQQIVTAATCLRALCPAAPALAKAAKFLPCAPQGEAQREPQCGDDQSALRPQISEGNGVPLQGNGDSSGSRHSPADPGKMLFDEGVALLVSKGRTEPQARSVLAKFQRDFGNPAVLEAMRQSARATDPVSAMRDRLGKAKRQQEYLGP